MVEIELNTKPNARDARSPLRRPLVGAGYWLSPILLLATTCGALLVLRGPDRWFGCACAVLLGLVVAWMLVSVFFPARVDRTCPDCGSVALERADPARTHGVRCSACGRVDPQASSFLMAEEEGVVGELVLRERTRGARRTEAPSRARPS